ERIASPDGAAESSPGLHAVPVALQAERIRARARVLQQLVDRGDDAAQELLALGERHGMVPAAEKRRQPIGGKSEAGELVRRPRAGNATAAERFEQRIAGSIARPSQKLFELFRLCGRSARMGSRRGSRSGGAEDRVEPGRRAAARGLSWSR